MIVKTDRVVLEAVVSHAILRITDLNIHKRGILTREICDSLEELTAKQEPDCEDAEWDVAENIGERMKGDGTW